MDRTYVALDLELTGLDPRRDEIIEIAMVKFRGDEILDTFSSLVRSGRPVPLKIQQLVGISQEEVDEAPTLRALTGRILALAANHPVVAHSVGVDLQFLGREGLLLNNLPVDTFELAGIALPGAGRYSLANLVEVLGIPMPQAHRALPDAMATKDLFLALVERVRAWEPGLLEELAALGADASWPLGRLFRDLSTDERPHRGPLFAPPAAPAAARPAEDEGKPLQPRDEILPVDAEHLVSLISPGGPFAKAFPGYEHRPQQVDMVRSVAEALNLPSHLLIEAGTGTGKSLAYLLPAVHFALQNERSVVISSNTINLQDQLFQKDLPDIQRILGLPFRAALLKGRSNYLCMRRLNTLRRSRQHAAEHTAGLAKVLAWAHQTDTGDRAELVLVNHDYGLWAQVQSTPETCLGEACPFRRQGRCFFYRARDRAERAHILVVNHALLLSDLAMENRVLPDYDYVVIDEAHHLEDVATDQFGVAAGRQDVYAFLGSVSHEAGGAPGGLVAAVPSIFHQEGVAEAARQGLTRTLESLREAVEASQLRLYALFNVISAFVDEQLPGNARQAPYDQTISLTSGLRAQPAWSDVEIAWDALGTPLRRVIQDLDRLSKQITALGPSDQAERDEILQEVNATLQRGVELSTGLGGILTSEDPEAIYWISVGASDGEITLHSAPLHVGPLLQERLFGAKECVILTSATLQTGNSFRYIKSRLGIEDALEVALDSPFDFKSAVLLYVPKDIPEPNQPYYQRTVEQAIVDLCQATEGRALILFTSNSQLNTTYRAVQRPLEEAGIVVFGQGFDGSRQQILDNFRNTPRSVLLGTRSFWEGVDVVGEALSCLVIAKLPFSVPTDPVFSARAQTFENPFDSFYLPDAILRFRQGFGRLIRSKDDFGLVVVLDRRLLTKGYGKTILRSLPPCTARQGPLATLPHLAQRWLDPANRG